MAEFDDSRVFRGFIGVSEIIGFKVLKSLENYEDLKISKF